MFSRGLEMQHWAGLKQLFVCSHPTLGVPVGAVGWVLFFYFGEGQCPSWDLTAFYCFVFHNKIYGLAQFLWLIYYEVEMPVRLYANQHN